MGEDAQADLRWVKVAPVSELAPGRGRAFEVDSIPVLLVNDGGSIFALHALCPHQGQNMDGGSVWRGVLDCPWHHFQYDVRSGENVFPRNVYPRDIPRLQREVRRVRTYPVRVAEGIVEVGVPPRTDGETAPPQG